MCSQSRVYARVFCARQRISDKYQPMNDFRMQSPMGPRVVIAGRERDYFSGTGYLGLHNHPAVTEAAVSAIRTYGMATGTSRGGFGEHDVYNALEAAACSFFDVEKVLLYPSGYMSAAILAQGLGEHWDRAFIDAAAHYSLWDGARSVAKPLHAFRHCEPESLAECLKRELRPGERPLVLTDGVFPISGEIAPVIGYRQVLDEYDGGWLVLDDAHATGVLGVHGRGTLQYAGLLGSSRVMVGHTLSKGIGGFGGVIPGSVDQINEIASHSQVPLGSSSPPLPIAAASAQALALASDPTLRERLWCNVARARQGIRRLGWALADTPVPILCLGVRDGIDLARVKDALFQRDICVAHVRHYSSTPGGGALRIAIFANHTFEQIDRLVGTLAAVIE